MTKKVSRRPTRASRPVARRKPSTALAVVKKPAPKKVTALAFRPMTAAAKKREAAMLFHDELAKTLLTDDTDIGNLGLVELTLTDKEELILSEPVPEAKLRIKPTGEVYLSHPDYTRWFNRAFGRLGWAIAPRSKPQKSDKGVVQPYILYVHGKPVAFALGEQDYYEGNKNQTWGDALESTVANALRRCAKRMGVGLEMWEPTYTDGFKRRECVQVYVKDGEKTKRKWRRRDEPASYDEVGIVNNKHAAPMTPEEHKGESQGYTMSAATGELPITDKAPQKGGDGKVGQVQRLWIICKNSNRATEEIKAWLKRRYGYESSKDIKRKHYDDICKAISAPGPLQGDDGRVREPGEDD